VAPQACNAQSRNNLKNLKKTASKNRAEPVRDRVAELTSAAHHRPIAQSGVRWRRAQKTKKRHQTQAL
jgi:hypothetical protein